MSAETPIRVVIVNFNAGDLLTACVGRVAASTLAVDIVVVDNASSDDSISRLRQALPALPRLTILENAANLGFARANNLALRDWRGEFALLLNPDCMVEPDTVARMLDVMRGVPDAGMAGCLIRNPDGSEQAGCRRLTPTPGRALRRLLGGRGFDLCDTPLPAGPTPVEAISGAFMLVRRAALQQAGLLDEDYFLHCEDLDWCMRFRLAGWRVLFVPAVAVVHVKGASSGGCPVCVEWHKHRGMVRYYGKFFRRKYPLPLMWLTYGAIWGRFAVLAIRMGFKGVLGGGDAHAGK